MKRRITRADIIPLDEYTRTRRERRKAVTELKKKRRVEVGPFATFYFESYETMWHQIHEMLYIEKGGEQQISDELEAYNPLIPQGQELIATVMIEIEDPMRRARVLATLGGIESKTASGARIDVQMLTIRRSSVAASQALRRTTATTAAIASASVT